MLTLCLAILVYYTKESCKKLLEMFQAHYPDITKDELKKAVDKAFTAYYTYEDEVKARGQQIITQARAEHRPIIV